MEGDEAFGRLLFHASGDDAAGQLHNDGGRAGPMDQNGDVPIAIGSTLGRHSHLLAAPCASMYIAYYALT